MATLETFQSKIEAKEYYEAHQYLRTTTNRLVRQKKYSESVSLLSYGALALLNAGQGGSGSDIALYLLQVYKIVFINPDTESCHQILSILKAFKEEEPTRQRFIKALLQWSGDNAEIHRFLGVMYAREEDVYEAEKHLIIAGATHELIQVLFEWYSEDDDRHAAACYLSRAVLPLLRLQNIAGAQSACSQFSQLLNSTYDLPSRTVQVEGGGELLIFSTLPLVNFLTLLVIACEKRQRALYERLGAQYSSLVREVKIWDEALEHIGQIYFGYAVKKSNNMLADLMGSLFSAPSPRTNSGQSRLSEGLD